MSDTPTLKVTKRDGRLETLDLDKIHRVLTWAAEGLQNVSVSQVELNARIQFYNGIRTDDIHATLIKAAADLISEAAPDYQYLAARLAIFHLRKIAYGEFDPPHLYDHVAKLTAAGKYDRHILTDYSREDFDELNAYIDHGRDLTFSYGAVKQLEGKYLVQNRVTRHIYETPQFLYILVAMCLFAKYPQATRLDYVKRFYDAVSTFKISLPTPIMSGVRTPTRQFSSCVKIECDDSLDSINASTSAVVKYVSQRAGIGLNIGAIRGVDAEIRGGEARHTGLIPFVKMFQAAVKSCSQGGVRGGAATVFYPMWHWEVESLLVLKNNKGVEDNRARQLDYAVQINKLLYTRLLKDGNITLFRPNEVPGLYEAFFADQAEFEKLYLKYEADESVPKKTVKAVDLFSLMMQERAGTGRIYIQNVDHCNTHSPFDPTVAPVRQSNLCVAPDTQILTDKGYVEIQSVAGTKQTVWNGHEWSKVEVVKTGENQPMVQVRTKNHRVINCTPYHKFYIKDGYTRTREVCARDLQPGDKLIKCEYPIIDGAEVLEDAYTNGFYTGDGCESGGANIIYLYGAKRKLLPHLSGNVVSISEGGQPDRTTIRLRGLRPKFFVPTVGFTVSSRLQWLAGLLDADGTVHRNGSNEAVVLSSINLAFLRRVRELLETLGTSAKIVPGCTEGFRQLPDGKGGKKAYWCKTSYRLVLSSNGTQTLLKTGLSHYLRRLKVHIRKPQREAEQFDRVVAVEPLLEVSDTYCFTEPMRHMGVFNGLLTGQCLEIALPTKPLNDINDENGEIALCTLSAFNLGTLESLDELESLADLAVRALDALLDYQDYPIKAAHIATMNRRTLGVGVINFAYYLAKNGTRYSDPAALGLTHRTFEAIQYYLLKASVNLAKEFGACPLFHETTYAQGKLPVDTYKKDLDGICQEPLHLNWECLRADILQHGLRNSTLTALMPSETSSQIANATNGIEPPRGLVSVKASKDGILKQVVPEFERLKDQYETLWQMPNNEGYLKLVGIMQKFVDQAISANTSYDPAKFESGKVPMQQLLKDLLTAYKYGLKTLYYHNTRDGADDTQTDLDDGCAGGACKI